MYDENTLNLFVKIGLINKADGEAAKQLLEEIGETAGKVNREMSESMPENLAGWKGYKNALHEAGEETFSMHERVHLLHMGLHELSGEIPGLTELTKLFLNPATAGFAVAVAGTEAYFHWLEKVEDKYRELILTAQKVNDDIREIIKSDTSADEKFIELTKAMAQANEVGRGLSKTLENDAKFADSAQQAFQAAADRAAAVSENAAKTKNDVIELLQALGQVSGPAAEQMKLQIEHNEKLQKLQDQRKEAAGAVANKQVELNQAKYDFNQAGGQDEAKAFSNKQYSEDRANRLEKTIRDHEKIVADLKDAHEKLETDLKDHPFDFASANRDRDAIDSLDRERETTQNAYEKAKKDFPAASEARIRDDKAYNDIEAAKQKIIGLTDELEKLKQKLSEVTQSTGQQAAAENQHFSLEALTKLLKSGATPDSIYSQGVGAIQWLNNLKNQGLSENEVIRRGRTAQIDQNAGRQLTDQERTDLSNYAALQKSNEAVARLKTLLTGFGNNANAMTAALSGAAGDINQLHIVTVQQIALLRNELQEAVRKINALARTQ